MSDTHLLKTHVWHGEECFFVSTIERESSAAAAYGMRYNETMAWEFDWENSRKGKIVAQDGEGDALVQHQRVVESLFLHGKYERE